MLGTYNTSQTRSSKAKQGKHRDQRPIQSWCSTSTRYHEEIIEDNDTAFDYGGVLEKEEEKEVLAVARQAKGEKKSDIKVYRVGCIQAETEMLCRESAR